MTIEPAEFHGDATRIVTVIIRQPLQLPNYGSGSVAPEINPHHFMVSEPDRLMMIMVRRSRMSHASQQCSRWGDDWKEKGTRIIVPEIPTQYFSIIYRDRCLVTGKWNDLASRHVGHETSSLQSSRASFLDHYRDIAKPDTR